MDCPTGGDPALQEHLCGAPAVEQAAKTASGIASSEPDAESWRGEVAVRLERYRARRKPRAPRYPSLFLPFDSAENWSRPLTGSGSAAIAAAPAQARQNVALRMEAPAEIEVAGLPESRPAVAEEWEPAANVIEFPRSASIPVFRPSELAEPILDRPRIVEAPEVLPPPPALGGILIEPVNKEPERRTGPDLSLPSVSLARRSLAGFVDGLILGVALLAFAAIFMRLNPERGPVPLLVGGLLVVAGLLWAAYEFLFVVYTGSTPGLRAARLRLTRFDGSLVNRRLRRWRVLASFLSAFSLGLGYLWSVLDEDGLCWHDRITHTHFQSATGESAPKA